MSDSRCTGTTRHGKPCQSRRLHGQQYCQHHMPGKAERKTITFLVAAVNKWERPFLSLRSTIDSPILITWDAELKEGDAQVLHWMLAALKGVKDHKLNGYPVTFRCSIARPLNLIKAFQMPEDIRELEYVYRIHKLSEEFPQGVQFRWVRPDENSLTQRYQGKNEGMVMTDSEIASGEWLRKIYESVTS